MHIIEVKKDLMHFVFKNKRFNNQLCEKYFKYAIFSKSNIF